MGSGHIRVCVSRGAGRGESGVGVLVMYPDGFHGWTMKRRILWLLRYANSHGDGWVHINTLLRDVGYTFSQRISELRVQEGYDIAPVHDKDRGWIYHLEEPPQTRLAI